MACLKVWEKGDCFRSKTILDYPATDKRIVRHLFLFNRSLTIFLINVSQKTEIIKNISIYLFAFSLIEIRIIQLILYISVFYLW
jgi:hypothetical protein